MNRLNWVIAALAVVAFVAPSLAADTSKAGPTTKTERSLPPGGGVKHEAASGQTGGEIRGSTDRVGSLAETRKGEPHWHRAHAEQVVVVDHRHHYHHHHEM